MADLLSKLRMLDAAPRRPAPAARGGGAGGSQRIGRSDCLSKTQVRAKP